MENQDNKTGYYGQANTVRISPQELEFVNDNYEEIAGTPDKVSFSKFFMQAVTKAVSTVKAKNIETIKDNPEHLQRIAELQTFNNDLIQKLADAENKPTGLVLDLTPEWRRYIWGVLEILKKEQKLKIISYEDLIIFIFGLLNARKELVLDAQDLEYLKTLEYTK